MPRLLALLVTAVTALAVCASAAFGLAANGTYLQSSSPSPAVYVVAGGAALHIDSCTDLSGCPNRTAVSTPAAAGYASVPANGTFLKIAADGGWVGEIVGGALLHVDACGASGTPCANEVGIDLGGAQDYMNSHPVPADGSFVRGSGGSLNGYVFEFIGAAPIHVGDCQPLNGCPGDVGLDTGAVTAYANAHPLPTNGTFVRIASGPQSGLIARAAGGAFLTIGDCGPIGGCPATIDSLDADGFNGWASAHPIPADGTYLLGLPSNTTWEVLGSERQQVAANPSAVAVDDSSLNAIPLAPVTGSTPGTGGTSPAGTSSTTSATTPTQTISPPAAKKNARPRVSVKFSFQWRWNRTTSQLVHTRTLRLKRPDTLTVTCVGPHRPFRVLRWTRGTLTGFLKKLDGKIFHAGDRVTFTVARRGATAERIRLTIRDGREPGAALL